jgi:spermidine synthase
VNFDSTHNDDLSVQRRGSVVELRSRSRRGEFVQSTVDLARPLDLAIGYTRTLFGALFLQPQPRRVLMIGLGGAGFHRLFAEAFPEALLHTVELDPKVVEIAGEHFGFRPGGKAPVTIMDGRLFVRHDRGPWDWIVLDAFRGGYVPAHLETAEFFRECAARLDPRGVFACNLHGTTPRHFSVLRTLQTVFPQVVIFRSVDRCNVVACAVGYEAPRVSDRSSWPGAAALSRRFRGHLDMEAIRREHAPLPNAEIARAEILVDAFAPEGMAAAVQANNTSRDV